ncbi:hypothetical protein TNCV_4552531 [Trichonephila clavipes]|nr:hypothetical protein TNCV_4552531 [Trichonephila clavipes]
MAVVEEDVFFDALQNHCKLIESALLSKYDESIRQCTVRFTLKTVTGSRVLSLTYPFGLFGARMKGNSVPPTQEVKREGKMQIRKLLKIRSLECLRINAFGERRKLKRLKNCHRSLITQGRLNSLAVMTIEYDVLQNIEFQDVLKEFTGKILRKPNI